MIFEWNIREAVPPLPFLTVDRSRGLRAHGAPAAPAAGGSQREPVVCRRFFSYDEAGLVLGEAQTRPGVVTRVGL